MKLSRIIYAVAVSAIAMTSLNSCRSTSKTTKASDYPATQPVEVKQDAAADFRLLADSYKPWSTVSVPVKVSLSGSMKLSLSGTLTMEYGKAVNISMRKLFFDAGRLYVDNDSVVFSSSLLNMYYAESMSKFTKATGLGLKDIQSMLLGQAFAPGKGTLTAGDSRLFDITDAGTIAEGIRALFITPRSTPAGTEWYFTAIAANSEGAVPQLFAIDIATASASARCTYAESVVNQAGTSAASMEIEAKAKNRTIGATFETTPSKAVWNGSLNLSRPAIPNGAKRVTTEQLLKKL